MVSRSKAFFCNTSNLCKTLGSYSSHTLGMQSISSRYCPFNHKLVQEAQEAQEE